VVTNAVPGNTCNTCQRADVLALLETTDGFRSDQQLHAALRERSTGVA
jgi:Fe2+ or Zn2+ uptake regulation protein